MRDVSLQPIFVRMIVVNGAASAFSLGNQVIAVSNGDRDEINFGEVNSTSITAGLTTVVVGGLVGRLGGGPRVDTAAEFMLTFAVETGVRELDGEETNLTPEIEIPSTNNDEGDE